MEVYLVPLGNRYELYCEVADHTPAVEEAASSGILTRYYQRLRAALATESELRQARRFADSSGYPPERRSWGRRLRDRVRRWVTEAIAEQRLLWHLRRQAEATLMYPADLDEARAMEIARGALQRDGDRHRFWLIVDGAGALILGPSLFFVPGPNLIAYYFVFRMVGHFLSLRGARHGLARVVWRTSASAPLVDLRQAVSLAPPLRARRVRDIASRLKLEHLVTFFERTAIRNPEPGTRNP